MKEMMSELSLEDEAGVRSLAWEAGVKEKRNRVEKCRNARQGIVCVMQPMEEIVRQSLK